MDDYGFRLHSSDSGAIGPPATLMMATQPLGILVRLPREIRDSIFTYMVLEAWPFCRPTAYMAPPAITRVSRAIRVETLRLFYSSNTWLVPLNLNESKTSVHIVDHPKDPHPKYRKRQILHIEVAGYRTTKSGAQQPLKPLGFRSNLFTSFALYLHSKAKLNIAMKKNLPTVKHDISCIICHPPPDPQHKECDEFVKIRQTNLSAEYQRLRTKHDIDIVEFEYALFAGIWDQSRPGFSLAKLDAMLCNLRGSLLHKVVAQDILLRRLRECTELLNPSWRFQFGKADERRLHDAINKYWAKWGHHDTLYGRCYAWRHG